MGLFNLKNANASLFFFISTKNGYKFYKKHFQVSGLLLSSDNYHIYRFFYKDFINDFWNDLNIKTVLELLDSNDVSNKIIAIHILMANYKHKLKI